MIEFADLLHFALPFLIVVQPALYHIALFGTDAELAVAATRIGNRENPYLMTFALLAARAAPLVEDGPLHQRPAQHLFRSGQ